MPSKNGLLYLILDSEVIKKAGLDIFSLADKSAAYGVDILQFRTKDSTDQEILQVSQKLAKIIQKRKKVFIVNDRADIAYLSGADGVHLGSCDISANQASKIIGKKAFIGRTIHTSRELIRFQKEPTNYFSFGPVFETKTKPELKPLRCHELNRLINSTRKLTFAIGGINLYNINSVLDQGVKNIAVCRGIIGKKDLKAAIGRYKECLRKVS